MALSTATREDATSFADSPRLVSVRGHHILADMVTPESVVVDLGAHFGEFSSEMTVRFHCRCFAVEPNPTLWNKIPEIESIRRFNLAISGSNGSALFDVSENLESSHLQGDGRPADGTAIPVQTVTLAEFARSNGLEKIDVLKVDIEGAEFDMFDSLSDEFLSGIGQIAVEFHDFIRALACDMAVARVKARLRRLGFACVVFSRTNNGDVLFVNRAVYAGTPLQWFYLEKVARYTRGLVRIADRWLHPITASSGR